jgi:hypothetical protein
VESLISAEVAQNILHSVPVNNLQYISFNRMKARTLCQIAEELRGQFLLTYTPDQVDKEGGFHKIAIKANKTKSFQYWPQ